MKSIKSSVVLAVVLLSLISYASSYNILGVFHTTARSHYITGSALMKGLAAAGHNVTVITHFPQSKPIPNYHDIDISEKTDIMKCNISHNFILIKITLKIGFLFS